MKLLFLTLLLNIFPLQKSYYTMTFPNINGYDWTVTGDACTGCANVWFKIERSQSVINSNFIYRIGAFTNSYDENGEITYTVIQDLLVYYLTPWGYGIVPGIEKQTLIVGNVPVICAYILSPEPYLQIQLRWSELRRY